ncbi:MAG: hypothetical protein L0Y44_13260 [Phycisphaerales bacterium]|nr:hypothetical protein [Phycisphaerales bacterium]
MSEKEKLSYAKHIGVSLRKVYDTDANLLEEELDSRILEHERARREQRLWVVALLSGVAAILSAVAAWVAAAQSPTPPTKNPISVPRCEIITADQGGRTFLLDNGEGRVWDLVEQTDVRGDPEIWRIVHRFDSDGDFIDWAIDRFKPEAREQLIQKLKDQREALRKKEGPLNEEINATQPNQPK